MSDPKIREENTGEWSEERSGTDNTMKEPSHKEYEAHDNAHPPSDPGPGGGKQPPEGVGESTTRRGEDVGKQEGRDFETIGKNKADRPIGVSDPDDIGVGGRKPKDDDMPNLSTP